MTRVDSASTPPGRSRVAVVVLTYNGGEVVQDAVTSLRAMTYPNFDLIVVDNGSTDGTRETLESRFDDVTVLRTEANLGPAGGCNLGFSAALEQDYDFVLILNDDIEVAEDMLSHLVEAADQNPGAGCVGPKEYYWADRQRLWSAGGILRYREAVTTERGGGQIDHGQFDQGQEVDYINGCAMLIRRDALKRTGPWDPLFHLGVEDADFCTRMKALGWTCWYAPAARLWHRVSFNTGVYSPRKTFHTGRSTAIYVRRHANFLQRLQSIGFILASLPLAFLRELRRGNQAAVVAKARGFLDGFSVPLSAPPTWETLRRP